jgi:RNA polymerase subunit RPABC4/transcription elongation factor Spt4
MRPPHFNVKKQEDCVRVNTAHVNMRRSFIMAFCAKCGTQLKDGAKFCASCGSPVGGVAPAVPLSATEKVGNIRKCPACGAEVPSMRAICPDCGHEFSNVKAASSVQAFFEKFDAVHDDIFKNQISYKLEGKATDKQVEREEEDRRYKKELAVKRQVALIGSYPIPNSKEDILEFVLLAVGRYSRDRIDRDDEEVNEAWREKCEQAYFKAKIALDKDTVAQIESILKEKKIVGSAQEKKREAMRKWIKKNPIVLIFATLILILIVNGILSHFGVY